MARQPHNPRLLLAGADGFTVRRLSVTRYVTCKKKRHRVREVVIVTEPRVIDRILTHLRRPEPRAPRPRPPRRRAPARAATSA